MYSELRFSELYRRRELSRLVVRFVLGDWEHSLVCSAAGLRSVVNGSLSEAETILGVCGTCQSNCMHLRKLQECAREMHRFQSALVGT